MLPGGGFQKAGPLHLSGCAWCGPQLKYWGQASACSLSRCISVPWVSLLAIEVRGHYLKELVPRTPPSASVYWKEAWHRMSRPWGMRWCRMLAGISHYPNCRARSVELLHQSFRFAGQWKVPTGSRESSVLDLETAQLPVRSLNLAGLPT